MDEQDQAINEPAEQTVEVEAPTTEVSSPESTELSEGQAVEEAAKEITETRQQPRAERRIRELSAKNRELQEQQKAQPQPQYQPLSPQLPVYEPGAEVSPEQLQRDVAQAADSIAQLRVRQALSQYEQHRQSERQTELFDADVQRVEARYGELNPDSDKYDARLSSKVTALYEKAAANNPRLRLADFVEEAMDLAGVGADKSKAEVRAKLTHQAASSAITPNTTTKSAEVDVSKMKPAERMKYLEKKIGFVK